MRKVFYWYVPAAIALLATLIFATGFYSYLSGDTGSAVSAASAKPSGQPRAAVLHQSDEVVPMILGDSLARGTGDSTGLGIGGRFVEQLQKRKIPTKEIVNIAINGARTADLLKQLDHHSVRVLLSEANTIIVSIGGNDLWGDNMRNAPAQNPGPVMNAVMERLEQVVKVVREANPKARIYVIGLYNPFVKAPFGRMITPLVTQWNARLSEKFAGDANVVIVETADIFAWRDRLSEDRFHPNGEGYDLIARRIADTF